MVKIIVTVIIILLSHNIIIIVKFQLYNEFLKRATGCTLERKEQAQEEILECQEVQRFNNFGCH